MAQDGVGLVQRQVSILELGELPVQLGVAEPVRGAPTLPVPSPKAQPRPRRAQARTQEALSEPCSQASLVTTSSFQLWPWSASSMRMASQRPGGRGKGARVVGCRDPSLTVPWGGAPSNDLSTLPRGQTTGGWILQPGELRDTGKKAQTSGHMRKDKGGVWGLPQVGERPQAAASNLCLPAPQLPVTGPTSNRKVDDGVRRH